VHSSMNLLFLGYGIDSSHLLETVKGLGHQTSHTSEPLDSISGFDLVVSFGYRHIITKSKLDEALCPVVNLHMSLLPWNRGAHPIFWGFFDSTPIGVTIHEIHPGIDTGPIITQDIVPINGDAMTFRQAHALLVTSLEGLFLKSLPSLLDRKYLAQKQDAGGSYHKASDLPESFMGWDCIISAEIERLKRL
jgi:methionyl-tRNA formyltransferase